MTKYIIIAAGEATRWGNHLGVPKHFAVINGEPIIKRTVRQLRERDVAQDDIFVVSKDYELSGVVNVYPKLNHKNAEADKFLSSRGYWSKHGRTVILLGDVYFTDNAIDKIMNDMNRNWTFYCRPEPHEKYGYPWGEGFAVSFYPKDIRTAENKLHKITEVYRRGDLKRCGGWEWARAMANMNLTKHYNELNVYTIISDATNDIDFPDDYERLRKAVEDDLHLS